MIILGLTGTLGSGKGTVVEYLVEKYGFLHFSVRDFIVEEIKKKNLEINRDTMVQIGNELRSQFGSGYIVEQLYLKAKESGMNSIIESIRTVGEINSLKSKGQFNLWAVDAEPKLRYDRIALRKSATDFITFDKFMEDEKREMESDDPNKQNLSACINQGRIHYSK